MSIIWKNRVDEKFDVVVDQDEGDRYKGKLKISLNGELLHTEDVSISHGAPFGLDISDVGQWCEKSVQFVDKYEAEQKKETDQKK